MQQHDSAATQPPVGAGPTQAVVASMQRQHESRWGRHGFVETGQQGGAPGGGVGAEIVVGVHRVAVGLAHLGRQPVQRVLVGGPHLREG